MMPVMVALYIFHILNGSLLSLLCVKSFYDRCVSLSVNICSLEICLIELTNYDTLN